MACSGRVTGAPTARGCATPRASTTARGLRATSRSPNTTAAAAAANNKKFYINWAKSIWGAAVRNAAV